MLGIIYPTTDSKWISPTQVIPMKSWVTVIKNKDKEMVPTRTGMSWHMCIDYRKASNKEDHFSLPSLNQVLERVAGHEFYYFLDVY